MRRGIVVPLVLLVAAAPVAGAQEGAGTVDPGMTKAQVIERLGQPAAERSRGTYTYLFYQNGCERTCGMSDLVTLESDTVVDAIFRAPYRNYAGVSSSPAPLRPELVRHDARPLAVPAGRPSRTAQAMAEEFAALLGESAAATAADPVPTAPAAAVSTTPPARPVSTAAPSSSVSREIAELLGNPVPPEEPESARPAPTPAPVAAKPSAAARKPALSAEVSELLGLPAPPAPAEEQPAGKPAPAAAPSLLSPDIADLLRDPSADTAKSASAAPARPVQDLPRPDTIKTSGRANAVTTWPPPREKAAAEPAAARRDSSTAEKKPAPQGRSTWPPPRDSSAAGSKPAPGAARPPADSTKAKKQEQPKDRKRPTWPPPPAE